MSRYDNYDNNSYNKREMHRTKCSKCNESCEVPFKPTGTKPVYCSLCFASKEDSRPKRNDRWDDRGGNDRGRNDRGRNDRWDDRGGNNRADDRGGRGKYNRPNFSQGSYDDPKRYHATCDECHKDCDLPFQPTSGKPIFCDECFGKEKEKRKNQGSVDVNGMKTEIQELTQKVNQILELLTPKKEIKTTTKKKESKKEEKPKKKEAPKKETTKKETPKKKVTKKAETKKKVTKKTTKAKK